MRYGTGVNFIAGFVVAFLNTACGPQTFTSEKGLVAGLAGRVWRDPVSLEPLAPGGVPIDPAGRTHLSFDIQSVGNQALLVASLYDDGPATAVYRVYSRVYREEVGLASSGLTSDFIDLASSDDSTDSLGGVGLAATRGGAAQLLALELSGGATAQTLVRYQGGDWGSSSAFAPGLNATVPGDLRMQAGPLIRSVFDGLGRVFSAYVETGSNLLQLENRALGGSIATNLSTVTESTGGVADRQVSLAFDGFLNVCALAQDFAGAATVSAECVSSVSPTAAATSIPLSAGGEGRGHAIAGGDGYLVAAYFAADSNGVMQVYVAITDDATFSSAATAVSEGMPSDFAVLGDVEEGGAPQVLFLGSGYFMVAWSAASSSSAAVYYSVADLTAGTWSAPARVSKAISFSGETPIDSFHLFGDAHGGAGIGVRYFSAVGGSRDLSTRKMLLSRYHPSIGWLGYVERGVGCTPTSAAEVAGCSHRPVGAILDSGATVVLFQDQDESGVYRWTGVEFR